MQNIKEIEKEKKKRKIIASALFVLASTLLVLWALIVWRFGDIYDSLNAWFSWLCNTYCNHNICDCDPGFIGTLAGSVEMFIMLATYFAGMWLYFGGYSYYKRGCFHCPDEEVNRDPWFPV